MKLPLTPLILTIVTLLVTVVTSMPSLAGEWHGKHVRYDRHLPPGLAKKHHGLPPGWQKKLAVGRRLDRDLFRHSQILVHARDRHHYRDHDRVIIIHDEDYRRRDGLITVRIDDRVLRLAEATHEIVDILR